jgi:hypothetical protein
MENCARPFILKTIRRWIAYSWKDWEPKLQRRKKDSTNVRNHIFFWCIFRTLTQHIFQCNFWNGEGPGQPMTRPSKFRKLLLWNFSFPIFFLSFSFLFTSFHFSPCGLKPEREIDAKFLPYIICNSFIKDYQQLSGHTDWPLSVSGVEERERRKIEGMN